MDYPSQASFVRRTDIALRAAYPHLTTRLFEIARNQFVIAFDESLLDATMIDDEFDQKIRPVTVAIKLSNRAPESYLLEIEQIPDEYIARGLEGFQFSVSDIEGILLSRYPELPGPIKADPSTLPTITLLFPIPLTPEQDTAVRVCMHGQLPNWPLAIKTRARQPGDTAAAKLKQNADSLAIRPARLRPSAPPYVREDEAFWFDNVDRIFEGRLHPGSFRGMSDTGMACYIDATSFPQIDLRQAVLTYDTVFFAPPLLASERHEPFWSQQSVSRSDVLKLVEAGRVRFVLTQPDERTDPRLLAAAYERDPTSILGRRTAAALMASDIVQTSNEYTLAREDLRSEVARLAELLATEVKLPAVTLSRLLLWPLHARRACLAAFLDRGLLGMARFSLGKILADELSAASGRDYTLEALATSDAVHVAHALNATLILPTREMQGWIGPRRIVGDRLNFYRGLNSRIAPVWAANERRKEERVQILPPIPLFEFDRHASIDDIIKLTSLKSTRRKGRSLMSRLAELPPETRMLEIDRLTKELYELGGRGGRRSIIIDTSSNVGDVAASIADIALFPVASAWELLKRITAQARATRGFDRLADAIEFDVNASLGRNSDLDFLSKISRVGELRDDNLVPS